MEKFIILLAISCMALGCQRAPKYTVELLDVIPDAPVPRPNPTPSPDNGKVPTGLVHEPKTYEEYNLLVQKSVKANQAIAINIGATWCGYCVKMQPHFAKLSKELTDVVFIKVTTDKWSEDDRTRLIIKAQVKAYPKTFIKYPNREWKNNTGYMEESVLRNYLGKTYNTTNSLYFGEKTYVSRNDQQ